MDPGSTPTAPRRRTEPVRRLRVRELATRGEVAALVAIVLVGAALRLPGIRQTSPVLWDDAYLFLEARFFATGAQALAASAGRFLEERRTGADVWQRGPEMARIRGETRGEPPFYGRPLHNATTLAAFALVGDVPWAGNLAAALLGTATIPLLYALGTRLAGRRAGLVAAAALAVSGYHVQYSRQAFSEATSVSFLAVALIAYLGSRDEVERDPYAGTALAGLAFGATMLAHVRWSIYAPLVVVAELELRRSAGIRGRDVLGRLVRIGGFAALPLAAAELPYYLALLANRHLAEPVPVRTWLVQNLYQFGLGSGGGLSRENWPTYPYLFVQLSGWGFTLATAAGVVACLGRRGVERLLPVGLLVLPLVLFSVSRVAHMRYGVVMTFAAALVIGVGLASERALLPDRLRGVWARGGPALAGVVLVAAGVAGEALLRSVEAARIRYAYGAAVEWMRAHGTERHVSTQPYVSEVFVGDEGTRAVPETRAELDELVRRGYRWLLTDIGLEALRFGEKPAWKRSFAVAEGALAGRQPVAEWPAPRGPFLQPKFEMNFRFRGTIAYLADAPSRGADRLRLYDLTAPPTAAAEEPARAAR